MNATPLVSVILPVHNRERLVPRAIDSVLSQSLPDFELLIIDDASTDGTVRVLERYARDPRVSIHVNSENLGPAGTRNRGIGLARGRYLAFQDSDDRWFPEKLEKQVEALHQKPECGACFSGALYYAREECYYLPSTGYAERFTGDLSVEILTRNPTTPQTLLIDRKLLETVGLFTADMRINEDWDLAIRLAQSVRFAFVDEPLVVIYRTPHSVSSDRSADARSRGEIVARYADLYARNTAALARQHYVAGSLYHGAGRFGEAGPQFARALSLEPRLKTFVRYLHSKARSIVG